MTNTVKHAQAQRVEVAVEISDSAVVLTVVDDGRGIPRGARMSGLTNISERALLRDGQCTIDSDAASGTRIEWSVPVTDSSPPGES